MSLEQSKSVGVLPTSPSIERGTVVGVDSVVFQVIGEVLAGIENWMNTSLPYSGSPEVNGKFIEDMGILTSVPAHNERGEIIEEDDVLRMARIINIMVEFTLVGAGAHSFFQQLKKSEGSPLNSHLDYMVYQEAGFAAQNHDWAKHSDPKIFEQVISAERFDRNSTQMKILDGHAQAGGVQLKTMSENIGDYSHRERGLLSRASKWAREHHERLNGSGYPFGHKENNISVEGKIMAIIDVFYALTEHRPYHPGRPVHIALQILDSEVQAGKLDPVIYSEFKQFLPEALKARNEVRASFMAMLELDLVTINNHSSQHIQGITASYTEQLLSAIKLREFSQEEIALAEEVSQEIQLKQELLVA